MSVDGNRFLLSGLSALTSGTLLAPLIHARDARLMDHGALDPPVPPVGAVEAITRPDGAVLHAVVSGSHAAGSPTFVLTHGLACDHRLWAYQARLLGAIGRVVTWDLRGHGASTIGDAAPARALGPDVAAADLAAITASLATGPVFLVGHSLGGMVSLLALRDHAALRRKVAGAAVIATPTTGIAAAALGGGGMPGVEAAGVRLLFRWLVGDTRVQRWVLDPRHGRARGYSVLRMGGFGARPSPAHVELVRAQIAAVPPAVRRATLTAMDRVDLRGTLGDVDVPTLVFAGGRDRLVGLRHATELAAELPHARSVVFERAGHAVVLERHAAITRRVGLLAEETLLGSADLDRVASAAT